MIVCILKSNAMCHRFCALPGAPLVVLNDACSIEELEEMVVANSIRSIVISPGPGGPYHPRDIGGRCPMSHLWGQKSDV